MNIWKIILFLPFALQAICMFVDEFYYHLKRDLPTWERWGHPLDTLSVLICFLIPAFYDFDAAHFLIFIFMGLLSCFLITKDEFIHNQTCDASEQWLHSVLFVLHPLVFVSTCFLWTLKSHTNFIEVQRVLNINSSFANSFLNGQIYILLSVIFYQIVYWNFIKRRSHARAKNK